MKLCSHVKMHFYYHFQEIQVEFACNHRRQGKCCHSSEIYSFAKLQVTFLDMSIRDHIAIDLRQFHRLKIVNEGTRCD